MKVTDKRVKARKFFDEMRVGNTFVLLEKRRDSKPIGGKK